MRKRSTLVVLVALFSIFGYYTWEYYSEKKYEAKERGPAMDKDVKHNIQ